MVVVRVIVAMIANGTHWSIKLRRQNEFRLGNTAVEVVSIFW